MTNSVTKEQVEEAFDSVGSLMSVSDNIRLWRRIREHLTEKLFPPPFKPKRGQVIVMQSKDGKDIGYQVAHPEVLPKYFRALTTTEINGESDD